MFMTVDQTCLGRPFRDAPDDSCRAESTAMATIIFCMSTVLIS
jgi:hypothetical protein